MTAYISIQFTALFLLFLSVLLCINAGHEVLYKFVPKPNELKANELAIIQYDSRPLAEYWNTSARWNKAYCDKYSHHYIYLSSNSNCRFGKYLLAEPWCKVKAMIIADRMKKLPAEIKAFLLLDSDVVITVNYSMTTVINFMQRELKWDTSKRPVALNQDGPGWSCKFTMNLGYNVCLNSGTVFWMRSEAATAILQDWWMSAGDAYKETNKFPSKWRTKVCISCMYCIYSIVQFQLSIFRS